MHVLVTGATGYIGGRLVGRLLAKGHRVRILVRDPRRVSGRRWLDQVEVITGDMLEERIPQQAFEGIDTAFYLIHSMHAGKGYVRQDRHAARKFCAAAKGLKHVIYLGGLLPEADSLSRHLESRGDVGRILASKLPTTELRAGPIIGSGSASFEMLRYITERLPIIVAPSWALNRIQPIAVRDVFLYLIAAMERGPSGVIEIGSEKLTYKQMMAGYARIRRLRRVITSVPPLIPPYFAASFIGVVTPIPRAIALPLVQGMVQPLQVRDDRASELFPEVQPISYEQALELALRRIRERAVETRWSTALPEAPRYEYRDQQGLMRENRTLHVPASPEQVFRIFSSLGGEQGWLVWNWAWRLRGFFDQLIGGPGLRRGRRDPWDLHQGEAVDFWRVEVIDRPHLLRLRGEIRIPGLAWLQWETTPEGDGTRLIQTAAFAPHGLYGALYWYSLYPFHRLIFTDMIREIARAAVNVSEKAVDPTTTPV